ncbi:MULTISPECIES: hypothetical protein [Brenneria]|uniref:Beta-xylosidase n=1 Tax=Brenneria nigrifluens DSM 30175 = ATCC 13028 TaxID=1121120 RepID=A0A2U1UX11_9GAMM|nr:MULTISPECIES: hypothetical protein [Brenneria]EHD22413.1 hypothetical protein BrE312_3045 [Brenneria sp. EniD312]PWC26203.1 hypothetical protein DDT54_02500 [Brenneria nigrifluens DSM 30175 = ATCC 13028]QCR05415.1 hypothetical protein EH206_15215 [Brenneria nigrifluens DSM 30175 = ATCC 13028]
MKKTLPLFINTSLYFMIFSFSFSFSTSTLAESDYFKQIKETKEEVNDNVSKYVYDKVIIRNLEEQRSRRDTDTQFGLHGMEIPAIKADGDINKINKVYSLLAHAGVDSLRSFETCWHRLSDKNGNPTNFKELDFQLKKAKEYDFSLLFVFGYPPAKFTVANNKLSAVNERFYNEYNNYLDVTLARLKGHNVEYAELANEVDAPAVWWIRSTPAQYVQEMKMLKEAINRSGQHIKTTAFSATYSRNASLGGGHGGRRFVDEAFRLGIDNYTDAYSIHHFVYPKDDLPNFIREEQKKFNLKPKQILDTEQLDTSIVYQKDSNPYDMIKIFARAFFFYDMKRVDYFLAQDRFLNNKLYSSGLFDVNWQPKLRLLAYAMAVDSMKGRELVGRYFPGNGVEAYVLKEKKKENHYSIVAWNNNRNSENNVSILTGIKGKVSIEKWNLDVENDVNAENGISLDNKPIAIYTNHLPNWTFDSKKVIKNTLPSHAPMPFD